MKSKLLDGFFTLDPIWHIGLMVVFLTVFGLVITIWGKQIKNHTTRAWWLFAGGLFTAIIITFFMTAKINIDFQKTVPSWLQIIQKMICSFPENLLLAILLVPIAWLLWIWRNHDKENNQKNSSEQLELQREKNNIENFLTLSQTASDKNLSDGIRAAALLGLRPFLAGSHGEKFQEMSISFFRDFLREISIVNQINDKIKSHSRKTLEQKIEAHKENMVRPPELERRGMSSDFIVLDELEQELYDIDQEDFNINKILYELRKREHFIVAERLVFDALQGKWLERESVFAVFNKKKEIRSFDFSGMIFENFHLIEQGINFNKCVFDFAEFLDATFRHNNYYKCTFRNAKFYKCDFSNSTFIDKSIFVQAQFLDSNFAYSIWGKASDFSSSVFSYYGSPKSVCNLSHCRFAAQCNFSKVSFYKKILFEDTSFGIKCNFTNAMLSSIDGEESLKNDIYGATFYNPKGVLKSGFFSSPKETKENTHSFVFYGDAHEPNSNEEANHEQYLQITKNEAELFARAINVTPQKIDNIPQEYK